MSLQDGERRLAAIPSESTFLEINTSATDPDKNCPICFLPKDPCLCQMSREESFVTFGEPISKDEFNEKWVSKFQEHPASFPRSITATETQSAWCHQALDLLLEFRKEAARNGIKPTDFPDWPDGVTVVDEKYPWTYRIERNARSGAALMARVVAKVLGLYETWKDGDAVPDQYAKVYTKFSDQSRTKWEEVGNKFRSLKTVRRANS